MESQGDREGSRRGQGEMERWRGIDKAGNRINEEAEQGREKTAM